MKPNCLLGRRLRTQPPTVITWSAYFSVFLKSSLTEISSIGHTSHIKMHDKLVYAKMQEFTRGKLFFYEKSCKASRFREAQDG
jgi:hypothetical protein